MKSKSISVACCGPPVSSWNWHIKEFYLNWWQWLSFHSIWIKICKAYIPILIPVMSPLALNICKNSVFEYKYLMNTVANCNDYSVNDLKPKNNDFNLISACCGLLIHYLFLQWEQCQVQSSAIPLQSKRGRITIDGVFWDHSLLSFCVALHCKVFFD